MAWKQKYPTKWKSGRKQAQLACSWHHWAPVTADACYTFTDFPEQECGASPQPTLSRTHLTHYAPEQ